MIWMDGDGARWWLAVMMLGLLLAVLMLMAFVATIVALEKRHDRKRREAYWRLMDTTASSITRQERD